MAISVSSLVWSAEGDQLNDPVITVLLSIPANLWWSLSSGAKRGEPTLSACAGLGGITQGCSGLS